MSLLTVKTSDDAVCIWIQMDGPTLNDAARDAEGELEGLLAQCRRLKDRS